MRALTSLFLCAALGACASPAPRTDAALGLAVSTAKAQQTIDPQASRSTDPVAGLGGAPAAGGIERYHESFRAPPPTFVIINAAPAGGQ